MWTSKLGVIGKPLIIGLYRNGTLMDFTLLTGPGGSGAPVLRFRLRTAAPGSEVSVDLVIYTDVTNSPPKFNAQRVWVAGDFSGLAAGTYIAEVDAHFAGEDVTFPDDGYFEMRFLGGID